MTRERHVGQQDGKSPTDHRILDGNAVTGSFGGITSIISWPSGPEPRE
jgi:hypothetical protein